MKYIKYNRINLSKLNLNVVIKAKIVFAINIVFQY